MKRILPLLTLCAALASTTPILLLPSLAVLTGCTSGCSTGKGTYNPSTGVYDTAAQADKLVVAAEKTGKIAADVFDTFMKFERENETALAAKSPAIHKLAEEIRAHGKTWLLDLDKAKVSYQANRGAPEAKTSLQQILAVVQSAIASVLEYTTQEKK
jgi:hypothetical protein